MRRTVVKVYLCQKCGQDFKGGRHPRKLCGPCIKLLKREMAQHARLHLHRVIHQIKCLDCSVTFESKVTTALRCEPCRRERIKTCNAEHRKSTKCKDKTRERNKAYHKANREKLIANSRAYHKANREKLIAKMRVYQETNKEKLTAYKKAYYRTETTQARVKAYQKYLSARKSLVRLAKMTEAAKILKNCLQPQPEISK